MKFLNVLGASCRFAQVLFKFGMVSANCAFVVLVADRHSKAKRHSCVNLTFLCAHACIQESFLQRTRAVQIQCKKG